MFDFGDPKLTTLAFELHKEIEPSGVLFYRARRLSGETVLEVLANTNTPVGQPLEKMLVPRVTIGHLVVEMDHELIIDDTLVHPLVRDSGAVHEMGIMAYIGVPCHLDGEVIGGISVVHQHRREWTSLEIEATRAAARGFEAIAAERVERRLLAQSDPKTDDDESTPV